MTVDAQNNGTRGAYTTLSAFLVQCKKAYLDAVAEGKGDQWTVVMGNEAGDLDSIASAIAYAWFCDVKQHMPIVPLVQTPRGDLTLRAENQHALSLAGLDPTGSALLCVDDVPHTAGPFPSTHFALVDHNRLAPPFMQDNPRARVVAIVDHHADEGLYHDTADPRVITVPTGSCSSLVAQLFEGSLADTLPTEIATLLLCGILVDTGGLKSSKAEDTDRAAATLLAPRSILATRTDTLSALAVPAEDLHDVAAIQELNETLQEKKASVSHLDTLGLLRRDYKEYFMTPAHTPRREILVGLASIPVRLKGILQRDPKFPESVERWMADRGLTVLGVLTSFHREQKEGKKDEDKKHGLKHVREQLYVVRGDEKLAQVLFAGLEKNEELQLKDKTKKTLKRYAAFAPPFQVRAWKQKNSEPTRKVIAPLVKQIIEGS